MSIIYAVAMEASYNIMTVESSKFNHNYGNNGSSPQCKGKWY